MVKVEGVDDKVPEAVFCDKCSRGPTTHLMENWSSSRTKSIQILGIGPNFLKGILGNVLLFFRKEEYFGTIGN